MLALPHAATEGFLFLVTRHGTVKRIALADFTQVALNALDVISVNAKDGLACALVTPGDGEVLLVTRTGRSIRFSEEKVRAMGTAARGVAGINLKHGDEVIAALPVAPDGELLTVTSTGYVKRTRTDEFSLQGRGGGGIIAHKLDERTGDLVGAAMLTPEHAFAAFITQKGVAKPLELDDIPASGRSAFGSPKVSLATSDEVAAVHAVSPVVAAIDSPPPPPEPQPNGRGRAPAPPANDSQEKPKKARATRKKAGGNAAAEPAKPRAQRKTRKLASETTRQRQPATKEETTPKQPAAEKANGEVTNRRAKPRAKPRRKSSQNKAREAASEPAAASASNRRRKSSNTEEAAPAPERASTPRQAKGKKSHAAAPQPKGKRAAVASVKQSVQGNLLDEPSTTPKSSAPKTSARSARKPAGKLDRVSSVTGGQNSKKR